MFVSARSAVNCGGFGFLPFASLLVVAILISGFGRAEQIVSPQDNGGLLSRSGLVLRTTGDAQSISVPITQWVGTSEENSLKDTVRTASLAGNLNFYDSSSDSLLTVADFAYIDCDKENAIWAYQNLVGNVGALSGSIPYAVVFFTTKHDYCKWQGNENLTSPYILTTLDRRRAAAFQDLLFTRRTPATVSISYNESDDGTMADSRSSNTQNNNPQNPLGPAPSTSAALIILYSITGVITALFLLIIITGAIRAHRHPDRYGPRPAARFGRPRQSRAKGLARAVLDTLPIVRFGGTKEEGAKSDAELQEPATQESDKENEEGSITHTSASQAAPAAVTGTAAVAPRSNTPVPTTTAAAAVPVEESPKEEADSQPEIDVEQVRCPVCQEDFEQGQDLRVLPCRHSFHPDCIDPWLLDIAGSCPLCRIDLRPEDQRQSFETPPSPPPAAVPDSHHSRFARYIDSARHASGRTDEERMQTLRQLREEESRANGGGSRGRAAELGLSRLRSFLGRRVGSNRELSAEENPRNGSPAPVPSGGAPSDGGRN